MARSYRTRKESVTAAARMPRDADGGVRFPRVVVRRPKAGDVHPLEKGAILRSFERIPVEYLYGLDRVELRARTGDAIGQPFGYYMPDERAVVLYSLPEVWRMPELGAGARREIERYQARVTIDEAGVTVEWPTPGAMTVWFFFEVLMHELGHHFVRQYRHKNGRIRGRVYNEIVADLHAARHRVRSFRRLRSERAQRDAEGGQPPLT